MEEVGSRPWRKPIRLKKRTVRTLPGFGAQGISVVASGDTFYTLALVQRLPYVSTLEPISLYCPRMCTDHSKNLLRYGKA